MKHSEYDANKSGFTSYTNKPVIKRPLTFFDRLKRVKLVSVFKYTLYLVIGVILFNLLG